MFVGYCDFFGFIVQVDFSDKCIVTRAIGTYFDYGRNALNVHISTIENRNEWLINSNNLFEFGFGMSHQNINDDINEYGFIDSADYVTTTQYIQNKFSMSSNNYFGYFQYSFFDQILLKPWRSVSNHQRL